MSPTNNIIMCEVIGDIPYIHVDDPLCQPRLPHDTVNVPAVPAPGAGSSPAGRETLGPSASPGRETLDEDEDEEVELDESVGPDEGEDEDDHDDIGFGSDDFPDEEGDDD